MAQPHSEDRHTRRIGTAAVTAIAPVSLRAGGRTPEEFAQHIRNEVAKWAKVTRDIGMRVD